MNRTLVTSLFIATALVGCRRSETTETPAPQAQTAQTPANMQVPQLPQMPQAVQQAMQQLPAVAAAGGGQTIAPGQTLAGALTATDTRLDDGSAGDDYTIMLTAGQPVTIITRGGPSADEPGSNLDVYTLLLLNGQTLDSDDDSAGNLNSRIVWTPTVTGPHTIRVSTFGSGLKQGQYTLQVLPGANENAN
jgi:hypothetical protein